MKSQAPDIAAAVFSTLSKVASTSSRVEKYNILASACGLSSSGAQKSVYADSRSRTFQRILKDIVLYAHNPNWVYRVTAPEEFSTGVKKIPAFAAFEAFKNILDDLRLGTENTSLYQVKLALQDILDAADKDTRKWLCMILNKDLKIGFRQWNKLFPGLLPEPKLMLCEEWDGHTINCAMYCEPKLDGLRLLLQIDDKGNTIPLSRGGKPIFNLGQFILPQIKKLGFKSCVLDGEVFAGNFGDSSSIAKSAKSVDASKLKFNLFDYIPLQHYKDDECTCDLLLKERKSVLHARMFGQNMPNVVMLPYPIVDTAKKVEMAVNNYMREGYEGCVLKYPLSMYRYGRSKSWLKFKPQNTADLEVYKAEPGQAGTRLENTMGALLCKGVIDFKGKKHKVKVSVGGGFSDEWREYFWQQHLDGTLPGTIIEVKYQDCTKATLCAASIIKGAKYSLRFPRFMRLRDDK